MFHVDYECTKSQEVIPERPNPLALVPLHWQGHSRPCALHRDMSTIARSRLSLEKIRMATNSLDSTLRNPTYFKLGGVGACSARDVRSISCLSPKSRQMLIDPLFSAVLVILS